MKLIIGSVQKKYIPLHDKVLVILPIEDPNKMKKVGGILVPLDMEQRANPIREANIEAVGPDCKSGVQKGDLVIFNINQAPPTVQDSEFSYHFIPEVLLIARVKQ